MSRQFHDYERDYLDPSEQPPVPPAATKPPPGPAEVDEVKAAADEAAKAAQEAAKAAAEASQSLMKGLSSLGGGFGFGGFGGGAQKPPAPAPSVAAQKPKTSAQNQSVMRKGPDPARVAKPCTYGMTPRQRWLWAFRKIQQVNYLTPFPQQANTTLLTTRVDI